MTKAAFDKIAEGLKEARDMIADKTNIVDTRESVEAMAAWHGEGKAWPAGVPMPQMHADQATAAMLRRLIDRAEAAERELAALIHDNAMLIDGLNAAEAALDAAGGEAMAPLQDALADFSAVLTQVQEGSYADHRYLCDNTIDQLNKANAAIRARGEAIKVDGAAPHA